MSEQAKKLAQVVSEHTGHDSDRVNSLIPAQVPTDTLAHLTKLVHNDAVSNKEKAKQLNGIADLAKGMADLFSS